MPRNITMRQFQIFTAVYAFSFSIEQVKAEDRFLVDEGKAYAEIIISESPARSTRRWPIRCVNPGDGISEWNEALSTAAGAGRRLVICIESFRAGVANVSAPQEAAEW